MATLKTYIDSPLFYDGVPLSATDINTLRNNAELLKSGSVLAQPVFDINRVLSVTNNQWFWRGGFQYRTGLTTATLIIYSKEVSGEGEHDIVIKFNGVEVARYDAAVGGYNIGGYVASNITITGRGYADYEIITVECIPEPRAGGGTDDASRGLQYVVDAYCTPLSSVDSGTWATAPTFGTINATNLNALSNAEDYLANRLAIVPHPFSMSYIKWMGTNNPFYSNFRYFTIRATNGNPRFRNSVFYICKQTQAYIRVHLHTLHFDYGPFTKGQNVSIDIDIDMIANGLSYDTDYFGSIEEYVTTPGSNSDGNGGFIFSRVSSAPLFTAATSYPSLAATPVSSQILENLSYTQVQSRLNEISSIVNDVHAAIVANPRVYNQAAFCRARYGFNAGQDEYWGTTFLPGKYRMGDVLWVKGQDVSIGYGPVAINVKSDAKPNDVWEYKFLFEEQILDGDKVSQKMFYLDQFKGLIPGMLYYLKGKDIIYAAEHLK